MNVCVILTNRNSAYKYVGRICQNCRESSKKTNHRLCVTSCHFHLLIKALNSNKNIRPGSPHSVDPHVNIFLVEHSGMELKKVAQKCNCRTQNVNGAYSIKRQPILAVYVSQLLSLIHVFVPSSTCLLRHWHIEPFVHCVQYKLDSSCVCPFHT